MQRIERDDGEAGGDARVGSRPVARRDVFISHASEDKDAIARPLAQRLRACGCSVWFDEYELVLGDSLRAKVGDGLQHSRVGVVILSASFFAKRWPQWELDGLTARHIAGEQNVILPVWHEVGLDDVRSYSAPLADLVAAKSSDGVEAVADAVVRVLRELAAGGAPNAALSEARVSTTRAFARGGSSAEKGPPPLGNILRKPMRLTSAAFLTAVAFVGIFVVPDLFEDIFQGRPTTATLFDASEVRKVITVDNRVTSGRSDMREDKPVPLTTIPAVNCITRRCDIKGTDRSSGQTYDAAVCQVRGERTTNGDNTSPHDDRNPDLFSSDRYYGVMLPDGRQGYVSEVWISKDQRGGLNLPKC